MSPYRSEIMALAEQACYTLINIPDDGEPPTEQSLKQDFRKRLIRPKHCPSSDFLSSFSCFLNIPIEKGSVKTRVKALKKTIQMILNGEKLPSLLMPIIQYALPMDDHTLKKLLLIYFEIVPKTQVDGKLLHEMILVCDAYRKVRADCQSAETMCVCSFIVHLIGSSASKRVCERLDVKIFVQVEGLVC